MFLKTLKLNTLVIPLIGISILSIKTMEQETSSIRQGDKVPFVYHKRFNIGVFGLEKLHPFDTHKYAHVVQRLKKHFGWKDEQFHTPEKATDDYLKEFHTPEYIDSLNQSWKELAVRAVGLFVLCAGLFRYVKLSNHPIKLVIFSIYALWGLRPFQARAYSYGLGDNPGLTIPFMFLPGPLLRYCLLAPMKYAVNGTALALDKARDPNGPGFCVNLSGGYHHARSVGGGGFCFFNDTALALQQEIKKNPNFKALIVDLDFHCGDGNADFASKYKDNVTIIDIYGALFTNIQGYVQPQYPSRSYMVEKSINFPNPVTDDKVTWPNDRVNRIIRGEKDSDWYCDLVKQNLEKVKNKNFDCIIFNAGTDVYEKDELGSFMGLTKEQIIARDQIVFEFARDRKIPLVQVLSGGYNKERGAEIVADCLINSYQVMQQKSVNNKPINIKSFVDNNSCKQQ